MSAPETRDVDASELAAELMVELRWTVGEACAVQLLSAYKDGWWLRNASFRSLALRTCASGRPAIDWPVATQFVLGGDDEPSTTDRAVLSIACGLAGAVTEVPLGSAVAHLDGAAGLVFDALQRVSRFSNGDPTIG